MGLPCGSSAPLHSSAAGTPKTGSAPGIPTNECLGINKHLEDSDGESVTLRQSG